MLINKVIIFNPVFFKWKLLNFYFETGPSDIHEIVSPEKICCFFLKGKVYYALPDVHVHSRKFLRNTSRLLRLRNIV